MRPLLFVAVVPPAEALVELEFAVARLREQRPDLHWDEPSRWHVTLSFLGSVEPTEELSSRLSAVADRHPPLELQVAGAGHFGNRVLWAGFRGDLAPLAGATRAAAAGAGFEVEDRPFRAHLTLARARVRTSLREPAAQLAAVEGERFRTNEILLMRSGRPQYQRLAAWPLRG